MPQIFNTYSKYYDLLYKDKNYENETTYIIDILKTPQNILELGCGTGKHAKILMQKGFNVLGIDLSEQMMQFAKNNNVPCEIGDVRYYRNNKIYGSIISLFHVASYQNTDEDVDNYFKTARLHCKKDGLFIFDVWWKEAVLKQKPEKRVKKLEDDEINIIRYCTPELLQEKNIVKVNYTIVVKDKQTNKVDEIKECHSMRYFSYNDIEKFASKNNFKIIKNEEWITHDKPSVNTWSVCFVCKAI